MSIDGWGWIGQAFWFDTSLYSQQEAIKIMESTKPFEAADPLRRKTDECSICHCGPIAFTVRDKAYCANHADEGLAQLDTLIRQEHRTWYPTLTPPAPPSE